MISFSLLDMCFIHWVHQFEFTISNMYVCIYTCMYVCLFVCFEPLMRFCGIHEPFIKQPWLSILLIAMLRRCQLRSIAKALGWGLSENKGPETNQIMSQALHFVICPSPVSSTHHKARNECFIMNLRIHRSWGIWRGGFLCLLLKSWRDLTPISRHNFPLTL